MPFLQARKILRVCKTSGSRISQKPKMMKLDSDGKSILVPYNFANALCGCKAMSVLLIPFCKGLILLLNYYCWATTLLNEQKETTNRAIGAQA